jgi:4-hydroxyproline epimerase
MTRTVFFCIDGHTGGNPVRLVTAGAPMLRGATMNERRLDFMARFDWIRQGLMFEPRGHDMMSGGMLYPPLRDDSDFGILYIETSGCLPMCGHGTIGMVTFALENGLVTPRNEGRLRIEVPAGILDVVYKRVGNRIESVRFTNVPSFLAAEGLKVSLPSLGELTVDVAYGGNFYAIIEPQGGYTGLDALGAAEILRLSPLVRDQINGFAEPIHPLEPTIRGLRHVLWADVPKTAGADGRNAVFYGERAIDRSPCGTGTSARLAQLVAKGRLRVGDSFVHESYIGSRFIGRVESATRLGTIDGIVPSIEGSAFMTGQSQITIDDSDPFPRGFTVV